MKITAIKVIVASPGRNFVTVKILTDEGLYGIGDATVNGREKAVVAYLEEHVIPILIGKDASRIEDIWQYLYKGAYWRRGPITMAAISGIDIALWDIKAKAANMPLYQLLGGASRDKVMIYQHVGGMTIEETVEGVVALREKGLQAIRAQVSIPGLPPIYGTGPNTDQATGGMVQLRPVEEVWATHKYLPLVPKLFERLRDVVGWDVHLLHDTHHRLTPIEAARLGKDLEPYRLFWLEDPVPAELQEGFRLIRQHTTTPIALGEVFNTIWIVSNSSPNNSSTTSASPPSTRAVSPVCAGSSTSPRSIMSNRPAMARWMSRPWRWAPMSTSTAGCPTSAFRNIPAIPRPRTRCSPTPGSKREAI